MTQVLTAINLEKHIKQAAVEFNGCLIEATDFACQSLCEEKIYQSVGFDNVEVMIRHFNELTQLLNTHYNPTENNCVNLSMNTAGSMTKYIIMYDVEVKGLDYYKSAYFYAYEVLKLIKVNHVVYRVLSSIALIYLMDKVIYQELNISIDQHMHRKLINTMAVIDKNICYPWLNYFGEYGIYLIYKNICKCHILLNSKTTTNL